LYHELNSTVEAYDKNKSLKASYNCEGFLENTFWTFRIFTLFTLNMCVDLFYKKNVSWKLSLIIKASHKKLSLIASSNCEGF
jgi:hypothetical protein